MVTGSHLAPHYNGFKLCLGAENVWGETLQAIGQMAQGRDFTYGRGASQRTVNTRAYSQYVRDIARRVQVARRLKVVVDGGNGTSGIFAPRLLELWGQEVVGLYLEPDGRYPNHLPNPQDEPTSLSWVVLCASMAPIWAWPLMVTRIASAWWMSRDGSSLRIASWPCWPATY